MTKILMQDKNTRKRSRKVLGAIIVVVFCLLAAIYVVVEKSGKWLVVNDEFEHATWAVILDGQSANMERNDYVADLKAQGKVDSVLILGRRVYRDKSNVDFYAEDFMRLGKFNPATIFLVRHDDPSTLSEACTIIPWLKKHKADTVLLVTAAPATRRAKRIFETLSGESPVYVTADIDYKQQYIADAWIFNRESRKSWLREWFAYAHSFFDLAGASTFTESDSTYFSKIRSIADEEKDEPIIDLVSFQQEAEKPAAPADTAQPPAPAPSAPASDSIPNNLK
ncbi:YdcF family protein [Fibrobacter sp. UWT3]|uniref:YdcF family protein n=1 Tax=Fibrobacter sp. UWT3 TaxID=1896225 RepID=UPI001143E2F4|nr:ElyC/SanA/YdcF family protein [Fibrobacter sp. UWT3]